MYWQVGMVIHASTCQSFCVSSNTLKILQYSLHIKVMDTQILLPLFAASCRGFSTDSVCSPTET